MPNNGFLRARVYTSAAQLPVEDATVSVIRSGAKGSRLLATRITDESGLIPILTFPTPPLSESQASGTPAPFTVVDIIIDHPDYERVLIENAQIFPDVISEQNVSLIPIEERPPVWNLTEVFPVTPQEL